MDMVRKGFGNRLFKDLTMDRKRVEKFEESLMWRLWMNQSCFTLGFLSQNSLWKLSFFRGYKGYLYWGENEIWRVRFFKIGLARGLTLQLNWVARSSREIIEQLVVLFCPVTLQLAWRFNFWHAWHVCIFLQLAAASHPRDLVASLCFSCTLLSISSHYLTYYLTKISPKYRVTKC